MVAEEAFNERRCRCIGFWDPDVGERPPRDDGFDTAACDQIWKQIPFERTTTRGTGQCRPRQDIYPGIDETGAGVLLFLMKTDEMAAVQYCAPIASAVVDGDQGDGCESRPDTMVIELCREIESNQTVAVQGKNRVAASLGHRVDQCTTGIERLGFMNEPQWDWRRMMLIMIDDAIRLVPQRQDYFTDKATRRELHQQIVEKRTSRDRRQRFGDVGDNRCQTCPPAAAQDNGVKHGRTG